MRWWTRFERQIETLTEDNFTAVQDTDELISRGLVVVQLQQLYRMLVTKQVKVKRLTLLREHQEPFASLSLWNIQMLLLNPAEQSYSLR